MSDERPVHELRNLGPKSGEWLKAVGFSTIGDLRNVGAVVAYKIVKQRFSVSLNLLWAMVAGLQDKDWRSLTEEDKRRLRQEVDR